MDSITLPVLDPDNDPWRRGIERPNAKRLSLSVGPLVARRSLLFRIKADLAGAGAGAGRKLESYEELDGLEDSPMDSALLYSLTPSASARLASSEVLATHVNKAPRSLTSTLPSKPQDLPTSSVALASAASSVSVYSQESWNLATPIIASAKPPDLRRQAMAFSPSLRWDTVPSSAPKTSATLQLNSIPIPRESLPVENVQVNKAGISEAHTSFPSSPLVKPTQLIPRPLSARLKLDVLSPVNGGRKEGEKETVGSIRLMDSPPSPLIAVRRPVDASNDGSKWHPQRKDTTTDPPVDRTEAVRTDFDCDHLEYSTLEKKPGQDESDDSKQVKRMKKFSKVFRRISAMNSKKDKHASKDGKKESILNPAGISEADLDPMGLSTSELLVPDHPAHHWQERRNMSLSRSVLPQLPPLDFVTTDSTSLNLSPLRPVRQRLPSLPPLSTPGRPLFPVHEAPPSTPARTPFISEYDENELVALQGVRAQVTRAHRRSRSSSSVPQKVDGNAPPVPVPTRISQVHPIQAARTRVSSIQETSKDTTSSTCLSRPPPPRPPRARRPSAPTIPFNAGSLDQSPPQGSIVNSLSMPQASLLSDTHTSVLKEANTSTHFLATRPRLRNHSLTHLSSRSSSNHSRTPLL